jgi:hypothetical protein
MTEGVLGEVGDLCRKPGRIDLAGFTVNGHEAGGNIINLE